MARQTNPKLLADFFNKIDPQPTSLWEYLIVGGLAIAPMATAVLSP